MYKLIKYIAFLCFLTTYRLGEKLWEAVVTIRRYIALSYRVPGF